MALVPACLNVSVHATPKESYSTSYFQDSYQRKFQATCYSSTPGGVLAVVIMHPLMSSFIHLYLYPFLIAMEILIHCICEKQRGMDIYSPHLSAVLGTMEEDVL